jgi:hypothetical protein
MLQISKPIAAVGVPVQPELGRPKQIDGPTLIGGPERPALPPAPSSPATCKPGDWWSPV